MRIPITACLVFVLLTAMSCKKEKNTVDVVSAIQAALPTGWSVLRVEDNPTPFYRPPGKGKLIVLGQPGNDSGKKGKGDSKPVGVHICVMAPDYDDGGEDPTKGQETQSWPPHLVHADKHVKIYLWPSTSLDPEWKSLKEDVLKALMKR